MKVLGRVRNLLCAFLLMIAVLAVGALPVSADERPDYRLQVSPSKLDIDLAPGKTEKKSFQVQNTGNKPFEFKVEVAPYSVVDENYDPNYSNESKYTDLAKWVTFSQTEGNLESDGSVKIDVEINVPKDVPAGGQYAAIMVSVDRNQASESEGAQIGMTQRIGLVMYSTVEGKTRKEGKVIENKVPSFKFQPPVTASSVVENTGNVHATATYTLQVFPLFGGEEVYSNEDKPDTRTILPETKRYNEIQWEGAPALGIFKVKQTVNFLGQDSVTEKIVFLCPIWFLFIILLLIFVIIFWIINRVRGRRAF